MAKARSMKPNSSKNKNANSSKKIKSSISNKKIKLANKKPPKWAKVKIAGNLVTDDGGGLEGLIGLEVLEDYNGTVISSKKV